MPEETNVYTVGGTVQAGQGYYLERQVDSQLLELCRAGKYVYILAPRQLGKSSLMMRTAEKLQTEQISTVKLDLTLIGTQVEAESWYFGILFEIKKQLRLKIDLLRWWQQNASLGFTQRLTLFIEEQLLPNLDDPLVIFVDEIDTTLSLDFTDDFFAAIRALYTARARIPKLSRLSFVLIGVATPGDLIQDPRRTPFNIGQRLDMTDFSYEEALPLAKGLNLPEEKGQQVLGWVLKWTGGHPYLTQRLCRVITEQKLELNWTEALLNKLVSNTFLGEKSEEDNNLQFVRDMLTRRSQNPAEVLTTYREVRKERHPVIDQEQSLTKSHLKLSGIVKRDGKVLKVRNSIYRTVFDEKWIKEHLPINWGKRLQQAAGLIAASLLLALVMSGLAVYAFVQQGEANKQADEASKQATQALAAKNDANTRRLEAETAQKQAEDRRVEAETAKNQSDRLRQSSDAQSLAFRAQTQTDPELALLLTIEAAQRIQNGKLDDTGGQVEASLRQALANYTPNIALRGTSTNAFNVSFSPDGKRLLVAGLDVSAKVYEVGTNKEIISLSGKVGVANSAVYSSDGNLIAIGDDGGNTIIYDAVNGKQLRVITPCECQVGNLTFSPNSKLIVEGTNDRTLRVLDPLTGKELWNQFNESGGFNSPNFSPDGKWLAGLSGTQLYLWDLTSNTIPPREPYKLPSPFNGNSDFTTIFSLDSRWLAVATADFATGIWDTTTGKNVALLKHDGFVNSVIFSPDGKQVLTVSNDSLVKIWETETGKELKTLRGHTAAVNDVILSPDGKLAITASADTTIRVWDYTSGKEVAVLRGHSGSVTGAPNHAGITFSPDGKLLASTSNDGTVRMWDWQTIIQKRTIISGYTNRLKGAVYSPDGKSVLIVANNETPRIVDSTTGKQILTLQDQLIHIVFPAFFSPPAISPDGKLAITLIGGFDHSARIWDVANGKELGFLDLDTYLDYALTQDFKQYAIARKDFSLQIRDFNQDTLLQPELKGHQDEVTGMVFSPDDKYLVSSSKDQTARIWEVESGKELSVLRGHTGAVLALDYSPDGKYVVTASADKTLRLWDSSNWQEYKVLQGHTGTVNSVVFSADGKIIISGSADKTVRIWEVATGKELLVLGGHTGAINSVAVSTNSKLIATASDDGTARVWDSATGKELQVLKGHNGSVTAIFFKPDGGSRVYTGGSDKTVRLWDTASGKELKVTSGFNKTIKRIGSSAIYTQNIIKGAPANVPKAEDPAWIVSDDIWRGLDFYYGLGYGWFPFISEFNGASFSPDSKLVATGSNDGKVRIWDSATGKLVRTLEGLQSLSNLSGNGGFSPDGKRLIAGNYSDLNVIIWDVVSGKQLVTLQGHTSSASHASFSPDGKMVVTAGGDNTARIWDSTTGKQLQILKGHSGGLYTTRFSPNGKFIVTSSVDGTARIWDVVSGKELAVLRDHSAPVRDASFSPDGKNILTASEDFTAIIQPCEICGSFADTLAQAKKVVTRALTAEEKAQFGIVTTAISPEKPPAQAIISGYRKEKGY